MKTKTCDIKTNNRELLKRLLHFYTLWLLENKSRQYYNKNKLIYMSVVTLFFHFFLKVCILLLPLTSITLHFSEWPYCPSWLGGWGGVEFGLHTPRSWSQWS